MADNPLTLEKMLRGSQNLDVWETATSGDENTDWTNLVGDSGPSLKKAIKTIMSKAPINSTPFATKAALIADTTLADGSFAFVYNDTLDNNGLYYKQNNAWNKASYDAMRDSYIKNVLGIATSKNIADLSKITKDTYVDFRNGAESAAGGFNILGFYDVEPNTEYQVPAQYVQQFAFYDNSKNFVSGLASADANHKFVTPSNARYIKFTVPTSQVSSFMVAKSAEYPSFFEPYSISLNTLKVTSNQVLDLVNTINNTLTVKSSNIIDLNKVQSGFYIDYRDGSINAVSGFSVVGFIELLPNTEYRISDYYAQTIVFFDSSYRYISGIANVDSTHKFVTPSNTKYAKLTVPNSQLNTLVLAESSVFDENNKSGFIMQDLTVSTSVKTTDIVVSADLDDTDVTVKFKGKNAIQNALDSITDATSKNRYRIIVKSGLYKITQANEFIGYRGYPSMILAKDYVDIIGQGKDNTVVWAELPYDDANVGNSIDGNKYNRGLFQTLYNYADDCLIANITFVAKNIRYALHQDDARAANKTRNYDNVAFMFKGNKGSLKAMGNGTFSGESTYFKGGNSLSDNHIAFSVHNNVAFNQPSAWDFEGHNFTSLALTIAAQLQNDGSLVHDKFNLSGCSFGGKSYILDYYDNWLDGDTSKNRDSFNHAEWQVTGHGNEPFLFDNNIDKGLSLHIKSNSTGANSIVRFDATSSAYPLIIKNNHLNSDTALYTDNRDYVDGYIVQDGSAGLSGQAWGCKDLFDGSYAYNAGTNYTSLAKRLGNLSSSAKSLVVMVDGVTSTVNFNKDYSAMSNTQILAEINAQLSNATADLVVYGRDYYPTITDMTETVYNNGSTYIAKGSVVTKQGGFVKLANANDKVYGVALDDIPVMSVTNDGMRKGQGRVLKRGYIYADKSKAHFVLADNQNPSIGTRFAVNNGQLVTDSNGKISVDIDSGVVLINC